MDEWPQDAWLRIRYSKSPHQTGSYAYEAFANAAPIYIAVERVSVEFGAVVNPLAGNTPKMPTIANQAVKLTAFHVGQGMCALVHNGTDGYLMDAGAGTPIRRPTYRSATKPDGSPFDNALMDTLKKLNLQTLTAIVSHMDSDHWRLLDWDAQLLATVSDIYLPSGQPALAFCSPRIKLSPAGKPRVQGIGSNVFQLSLNGKISVFRSQPVVSESNGECLVAVVECAGEYALLAGDYVYDRMAADYDAGIRAAAADHYHAVVVPHHGDTASAALTVTPLHPKRSIAFFSAGNHAGYGHPTNTSILAHQARDFDAKDWRNSDDILIVPLLP